MDEHGMFRGAWSSPDSNHCEYFYNLRSIESELDSIFGKNNYVMKRQQVVYGFGFAFDDHGWEPETCYAINRLPIASDFNQIETEIIYDSCPLFKEKLTSSSLNISVNSCVLPNTIGDHGSNLSQSTPIGVNVTPTNTSSGSASAGSTGSINSSNNSQ